MLIVKTRVAQAFIAVRYYFLARRDISAEIRLLSVGRFAGGYTNSERRDARSTVPGDCHVHRSCVFPWHVSLAPQHVAVAV